MRLEDKLVDGRDAAHEESLQRADTMAHGEDKLPEPVAEAVVDAGREQRAKLLDAVRLILAGQTVSVHDFHLPPRESLGLESLQIATSGRDGIGEFVYASDRRDLLERALAVLQPDLTHVDDATARELHAQLGDLTTRVAELRLQLTNLEEAQDEVLEPQQKAALEAAAADASDTGDKPKPKPSDPDAPRPATTLTGPERPEPPRSPTTLVGPAPPEPARPTTLVGPELPPEPARPTTLVGPELAPEPARPTTLVGPELPPEPSTATTLGDPDEIATPKRPWWRRPFG